jgi:hypothetical protein
LLLLLGDPSLHARLSHCKSCQALMASGDNTTAKNSEASSKSYTNVAPYFLVLESSKILPRVASERTTHSIFCRLRVPKRNSQHPEEIHLTRAIY